MAERVATVTGPRAEKARLALARFRAKNNAAYSQPRFWRRGRWRADLVPSTCSRSGSANASGEHRSTSRADAIMRSDGLRGLQERPDRSLKAMTCASGKRGLPDGDPDPHGSGSGVPRRRAIRCGRRSRPAVSDGRWRSPIVVLYLASARIRPDQRRHDHARRRLHRALTPRPLARGSRRRRDSSGATRVPASRSGP